MSERYDLLIRRRSKLALQRLPRSNAERTRQQRERRGTSGGGRPNPHRETPRSPDRDGRESAPQECAD